MEGGRQGGREGGRDRGEKRILDKICLPFAIEGKRERGRE